LVPPIKLYFVGSILHKEKPNDVDICGVLSNHDFELTFGYDHDGFMQAFKEEEKPWRLKRWESYCKGAGWALHPFFGKKVDFKWVSESMLYTPNQEIDLDKCNIHL